MIFILPPSLEVLEKRLSARATDPDDIIQSRIKQARDEIRKCDRYDYLIINDDLDTAVKEAEAVIISDRRKKDRVLSDVKQHLGI